MGHTNRYKFGFEKKKDKKSQYIVSRPELGSDPPFGSDRESGCDNPDLTQLQAFEPEHRRIEGWMTAQV